MSTLSAVDNAVTVRKMYEAFQQGDISFILDQVAEECVWTGTGEGYLPSGGVYNGKKVGNFFKALSDSLDFKVFNVESINTINDREVVVFGNMKTTAKKTGKTSSSDWAMHWKFNDAGKAVYYHDFHDTAAEFATLN